MVVQDLETSEDLQKLHPSEGLWDVQSSPEGTRSPGECVEVDTAVWGENNVTETFKMSPVSLNTNWEKYRFRVQPKGSVFVHALLFD